MNMVVSRVNYLSDRFSVKLKKKHKFLTLRIGKTTETGHTTSQNTTRTKIGKGLNKSSFLYTII